MNYKRLIYSLLLLLLSVSSAWAVPATIKARLDSAHLIMGNTTMLHIEVVKQRGSTGFFPMYAEAGAARPYVGVNGDSVELSRSFTSDTVELGAGRTQINYNIPLQAFDSGFYHLPQIEYVTGLDTIRSNRVALKVMPIAVDPQSNIDGFTPPADAPKGNFLDKLPDALVDYWWIILLIIAVITGLIIGIVHYRRTGAFLPKPKPQLPPYEAAMKALQELRARKLWQQGLVEEYFVQLTDILRGYIAARFKVSAPEMTTEQFLAEAGNNEKLAPYSSQLRRLLELADFVKFARMQSLPDENNEAFDIVSNFISTTRPSEQEEQERKMQETSQQVKARKEGKK